MEVLVYENVLVRLEPDRREGCLTDMFRAYREEHRKAGGLDKEIAHKAPSQWLRLPTVREFREFVRVRFNGGIDPIWTQPGNGGGTWGHWQMMIAYAQYLSNPFWAWCNTAARAVMEGTAPVAQASAAVMPETAMRRFGGMMKTVTRAALQPVIERLQKLEETVVLVDPTMKVVKDLFTANEFLVEARANQKGRRDLLRKISADLESRRIAAGIPDHRLPCRTHLYPRELGEAYMRDKGLTLVRAHNSKAARQLMLELPEPRGGKTP